MTAIAEGPLYDFDGSSCGTIDNEIDDNLQDQYYEGEKIQLTMLAHGSNCEVLNRDRSGQPQLEYDNVYVNLPRIPRGDVEEIPGAHCSISLNKDNDCYELYGIQGHDGESTIDLDWGGEYSLLGNSDYNFVTRYNDCIGYAGNVKLRMPSLPYIPPDYGGDITNIYQYIDDIWHDIYIVSGEISVINERIDGLSDEFWLQGGTSETNYCDDATIHELYSDTVQASYVYSYDVGANYLYSSYLQGEYAYVNYELYVAGPVYAQNIACDGNIQCQGNIKCETLTIGDTTINESQLQKLLALIEDE